MTETEPSYFSRLKSLVFGGERSVHDKSIYHKLSLAAFLAWVGLGSDGLSSSCYGPPEAFAVLHAYPYLGVFVALGTAVTIFVISASYSQIVELFPSGGGGYLVASKMLSKRAGALSGCALLVDYVLTIAISVASGVDALFSFLPPQFQMYKLSAALVVVLGLTLLNIRGVKESVVPLVPVFLLFVFIHLFVIVYGIATHMGQMGSLVQRTAADVHTARSTLGLMGMLFLIMHSYSMGAGTYTGIEAVSNGMAMLREPRTLTAKRTMTLMWTSLAVMAVGLMLAYLIYHDQFDWSQLQTKTLNAMMLEEATRGWNAQAGRVFVVVTLLSEAAILTIAAQTGFLGGPRILANMALDRWLPTRLSLLSDRLVTRNGVLIMSGAAVVTMLATGGRMDLLIVLYSINVFITFALSQTGMVKHWWNVRREERTWGRRMAINGLGLVLTVFILVWVTVAKFHDGGWATLVVTAGLMVVVSLIRKHYETVAQSIAQFNKLAEAIFQANRTSPPANQAALAAFDPNAKTAVLLVGGFNGLGLHSLQNVIRYFGDVFRNFVFIAVGIVDAGNFKGAAEVTHLDEHLRDEVERYVELMRREGYYAESRHAVGTDIADEIAKMSPEILKRFPQSVFFAGQLIFSKETFVTRWLHNNVVFLVQKRLYRQGIPFVVMPFRV